MEQGNRDQHKCLGAPPHLSRKPGSQPAVIYLRRCRSARRADQREDAPAHDSRPAVTRNVPCSMNDGHVDMLFSLTGAASGAIVWMAGVLHLVLAVALISNGAVEMPLLLRRPRRVP